MRAVLILASVALTTAAWGPVGNATYQDRRTMAAEAANSAEAFGVRRVEIGAAVIASVPSGRWALADWRSARGARHGRVLFFYACDHWNVRSVMIGSLVQAQRAIARHLSQQVASELVASLAARERQNVSYLMPARPGPAC